MQGSQVHHYTIEKWDKHDGQFRLAETKTSETAEYTFKDIIGTQEYQFRVATHGAETGKSAWSEKRDYTAPLGKPSVPQSFNKKESGDTSITVEWEAPASNGGSALEGYIVEYKLVSEENDDAWTEIEIGKVSTHKISNLAKKTEYQIRIAARNSDHTGDFSSFLTVATAGKGFKYEPEVEEGLSGAVVAVIVVSAILLVGAIAVIAWLAYVKKDE